jgi:hypothetical protein
LIGSDIPKEIIGLPEEFLNTPAGRMISPMIQSMEDNLKVNSHQLFDNTGYQNPLVTGPSAGSMPSGNQGFGNQQANQMNDFINMFA